MANQDRLLSTIFLNVLAAIAIIVLPTVILLGIIGGRVLAVEGAGVIVDLSLGSILVFSSLAAVLAPFVYRMLAKNNLDLLTNRTGERLVGNASGKNMDCGICSVIT